MAAEPDAAASSAPSALDVRQLTPGNVAEADRIFRLALGTFLTRPDAMQFAGDGSWIATRFAGRLGGAHAAVVGDRRR